MSLVVKHRLTLDPLHTQSPTRDHPKGHHAYPSTLAAALETKIKPTGSDDAENATVFFVGTATAILEWEGIRLLTDPNFLHAGDHVHLGPGVTATRQTNPAVDLHDLPPIDAVLLSHYHADHFDHDVEQSLRRDLPILTTKHARECLVDKKVERERFTSVFDLENWESVMIDVNGNGQGKGSKAPAIKVTGMPGKHVPPGPLNVANDLLGAVPPTNGWMIELGYKTSKDDETFQNGYRIYVSGDTLMVDELQEIPKRYAGQNIDLMLVHLGGTTIPSSKVPLLMVTMDATQGVQLMQLVKPEVTVPIHFDDYDVFLSPLDDFKEAVTSAGWDDKVVYLDRGDKYRFAVKRT